MKEEKQYSCLYVKNGKRTCEEKFGCDGNGKIFIHFPDLRFTEEKNCERYVMNPDFMAPEEHKKEDLMNVYSMLEQYSKIYYSRKNPLIRLSCAWSDIEDVLNNELKLISGEAEEKLMEKKT